MYKKFFKRFLDFAGALTVIGVTLPVWLTAAVVLAVENNGKIFFRQQRAGKNGRLFTIIKFRTMTDRKGPDGSLLPDKERVTKTGQWMRLLSIDELPQFINVLKGEMSFIGPRPLLPEYLPLYSDAQRRRHEVTPGMTGWAQCHGRNEVTWAEKFRLDVWYVDNQSFLTDCRIIYLTIMTLLHYRSNNSRTSEIEKFNGHN